MRAPDPLPGVPGQLRAPLLACAAGERPPNIALMQLAQAAGGRRELEAALQRASQAFPADTIEAERLEVARRLWAETPQAWDILHAVLEVVGTDAPLSDGVSHWSEVFDRLAAISPNAGVALYSLGRGDLLDAATAEIVERMREWGCLGPERILLEIGCGSGRFLAPLAREVRLVVGSDVSLGMLREARRQTPSAALLCGSGRDLSAFRDAVIDTVYAVDVFPYLVMAGEDLAAAHVREAFRVLRPGGQFLLLNYSYRGDFALDCADVARHAGGAGFAILQSGGDGLRHWDGRVFRLCKP